MTSAPPWDYLTPVAGRRTGPRRPSRVNCHFAARPDHTTIHAHLGCPIDLDLRAPYRWLKSQFAARPIGRSSRRGGGVVGGRLARLLLRAGVIVFNDRGRVFDPVDGGPG